MIIPAERLSEAILRAIIEEYVTREGTDYGHGDYDLEGKVAQVHGAIQRGDVVVVFDADTETCSLRSADELTSD